MLKLEIDNIPIEIDFIHNNVQGDGSIKLSRKEQKKNISYTKCQVKIGKIELEEVVQLSKQDNFNKSEGRKKSMKKLLLKSGLIKKARTEIWTQYFKKCKI